MKRDLIKTILLMSLPLVLSIFFGIFFLFADVYDGPTKIISGEITLFNKGSSRRYGSTPMHIKIEDDKYIITGGVRWSTDYNELKDTLSVGNSVTIEYYEKSNINYVGGIKYKDNVLVTKTEYIEGQHQQNNLKSTIVFYIGYTYLLIEIMILFALSKKFSFDVNLGYMNKVIINKFKFGLNIVLSISLIIGSFAVIAISKWLYFPAITISLAYLFYTLILNDRLYFGTGGFRILIKGKKKHYCWNAIKEMMQVDYKNKKVVVLNFKENYNFEGNDITRYLRLTKEKKNKFVYVLYLTKKNIHEFDSLQKIYYVCKKVRDN